MMRLPSAFLALFAAACVYPRPVAESRDIPATSSVLLVSLDGFRADYINRPGAIRLRMLAAAGVRAERMVPSFPTKTFPNHYTLVTGLYPEHHGIVANVMYDATIGKTFVTADTMVTHDPRWWGGEPLWNTVTKQRKKSASFFWVGSDIAVNGMRPALYRPYDGRVPNAVRVRTVLDWLQLPAAERPLFVSTYFNDTDEAGHRFGPDAPETDAAIARVDSAVGALVDGLAERGMSDRVNLVVVSDHGMTPLAPDRVIYLDDYLDLTRVKVIDINPVGALVPAADYEDDAYHRLRQAHPHLQVYRKTEVPARLHFRAHPRIAPLIAIADEGWTITTHAAVARSGLPRGGNHGFDNALPSMGALFVASGPAFRKGVVVPPFQNIHVYALLSGLLGVAPAPNDGSVDSTRALLRGQKN
jgi:predicted AlkP superfamily pyrophosphatase or phosphodiesterase